jgi:hypothetical protein
MKTLAELKREAKTGNMYLEMVYRFGSDIPEKLKGKRKVIGSNSVSISLLTTDGRKSELRLEKASLVEYDGDMLTIYGAGSRELNEKEQDIVNEWKKITSTKEYKEKAYHDAISDGGITYWKEKKFFKDKGALYLMGCEKQKGLLYDFNAHLIIDESIKGKKELQYKVYKS